MSKLRERTNTVIKHHEQADGFKWEGRLLLVLCVIASVMLCVMSVTSTAWTDVPVALGGDSAKIYDAINSDIVHTVLVPLIMCIPLLAVIYLIGRVYLRLGAVLSVTVTCCIMAIMQILWIGGLGTVKYGFADSHMVSMLASNFLNGDYSAFQGHTLSTYTVMYPYQSGMILAFSRLYSIVGNGNERALQYINALANIIAFIAIAYMVKKSLGDDATCWFSDICMMFFPFWASSEYVYGNIIAFAMGMVALAMNVCVIGREKGRVPQIVMLVLSFIILSISCVVKSTNILIAMGIVIFWLVYALRNKAIVPFLVSVVGIVLVWSAGNLATAYLENKVGNDFGNGAPKSSWILMANTRMDDEPFYIQDGWWRPDQFKTYAENQYDAHKTDAQNKVMLYDAMHGYMQNPSTGLDFYSNKLRSEWANPDFNTLYLAAIGNSAGTNDEHQLLGNSIPNLTVYDGIHWNSYVKIYLDTFQNLSYILMTAGIIIYMRKTHKDRQDISYGLCLLLVCFFIGWCCYILWEAKGIYTLPFYMLLLPTSTIALVFLDQRVESVLRVSGFL